MLNSCGKNLILKNEIRRICKLWLKPAYADIDYHTELMVRDIMEVIEENRNAK